MPLCRQTAVGPVAETNRSRAARRAPVQRPIQPRTARRSGSAPTASTVPASDRQDHRRRAEHQQDDRDEPPRAGRRQPRQQPEAAGERSDDRAERVGRVRAADLRADAFAPAAEQRDEQRELIAGDERRRQHDDDRDDRPAGDARAEPRRSRAAAASPRERRRGRRARTWRRPRRLRSGRSIRNRKAMPACRPRRSAYSSPPRPMPASATASTRPKVKTDPPSSGASSRYQTSSIRKNAKPTVAEARRRNGTGAWCWVPGAGCVQGARVPGAGGAGCWCRARPARPAWFLLRAAPSRSAFAAS